VTKKLYKIDTWRHLFVVSVGVFVGVVGGTDVGHLRRFGRHDVDLQRVGFVLKSLKIFFQPYSIFKGQFN
jgi:hypothetical protein